MTIFFFALKLREKEYFERTTKWKRKSTKWHTDTKKMGDWRPCSKCLVSGSRRFSLKDQVLMGETGVILDTDDSEKIREL